MSRFYKESEDVRGLSDNPALWRGKMYRCLSINESNLLKSKFKYKSHQKRVIDWCRNLVSQKWWKDNRRGIVLYHTLGLGKTCSSIGIADALLRTRQFEGVVVLTPASLRLNFVQEYCAKCGLEYVEQFQNKFRFYAYNYTGIINDFPKTLERVVIIIDELHNLISGKMNGARVRSQLFDIIAKSKNSFIIGLTGTPIYSTPSELYYYGELFLKKNYLHTWGAPLQIESQSQVEPESENSPKFESSEFQKHLNNQTLLARALEGVVSYVTPENNENYPSVKENAIIYTPLVVDSASEYNKIREGEIKMAKSSQCLKSDKAQLDRFLFFEEAKKTSNQSACYLAITKFMSIRLSNIWYPLGNRLINKVPYSMRINMKTSNEIIDYLYGLGFFSYEKVDNIAYKVLALAKQDADFKFSGYDLESFKDSYYESFKNPEGITERALRSAERFRDIGKIDRLSQEPESLKELNYYLYSDKQLYQLQTSTLQNLQNHPNISYFEEEKLRNEHSPKFWTILHNIQTIPGKHAVFCYFKVNSGVYLLSAILTYYGITNWVYSGDLSMEGRQRILDLFNDDNNITGEKYRVLLLTDAGTEGLSLMSTETIHIVSPKINQNKINQVIGRIRRLNSHNKIEDENRRSVRIYYYLTTFNPDLFFTKVPNVELTEIIEQSSAEGEPAIDDYFDVENLIDKAVSILPDSLSRQDLLPYYAAGLDSSDQDIYKVALKRELQIQSGLKILVDNSLEKSHSEAILALLEEVDYQKPNLIQLLRVMEPPETGDEIESTEWIEDFLTYLPEVVGTQDRREQIEIVKGALLYLEHQNSGVIDFAHAFDNDLKRIQLLLKDPRKVTLSQEEQRQRENDLAYMKLIIPNASKTEYFQMAKGAIIYISNLPAKEEEPSDAPFGFGEDLQELSSQEVETYAKALSTVFSHNKDRIQSLYEHFEELEDDDSDFLLMKLALPELSNSNYHRIIEEALIELEADESAALFGSEPLTSDAI